MMRFDLERWHEYIPLMIVGSIFQQTPRPLRLTAFATRSMMVGRWPMRGQYAVYHSSQIFDPKRRTQRE